MSEGVELITITEENLKDFAGDGFDLRIGDQIQIRKPEQLDMRLFGQLRTWLGDPPNDL